MRHSSLLPVVMGVVSAATVAHAHHSIAAVYDGSRQLTLEGVVVHFDFVHPHPFITMTVRPAGAAEQAWRLEMDNRFELAAIGMTADTFKAGDRVVVSGSPGRTQATALYIRKLERPADAFEYEQVGFSPRISQ